MIAKVVLKYTLCLNLFAMLLLVTYLLILFLCWFWLYQYIVNSLKYALFYLLILYSVTVYFSITIITLCSSL